MEYRKNALFSFGEILYPSPVDRGYTSIFYSTMTKQDKSDVKGNKMDSPTPPKSEPVVFDPDEDENAPYFNFGQIGAFFSGCWGKIAAFSKSSASKTWGWCRSSAQWTWSGVRKLPSYCVIRWDSEEKTGATDAPSKPEPAKIAVKPDAPAKVVPAKTISVKTDYDEDELAPSRWWSIGIKAAAAAAALLILTGGYFGVKMLLHRTPVEVVDIENAEQHEPTVSDVLQESAPVVAPYTPESALAPPAQGSLLDNDPFFAPSAAPAIAGDHFGAATVPAESTAPIVNITEDELPAAASALQPLTPLGDTAVGSLPQLQPLVALDSIASPQSAVADVPTARAASANAPVASNYNPRTAQRNLNNPTFGDAPTPPVVNTIPQTTVPQTFAMTKPVREIVPQIPYSGTIQEIPPPIAPPTPPSIAEASPARSVYANESTPIIPKDAPVAATPVVPVVPVVAASVAPLASVPATDESASRILSADSQPMDWQLWEHIRELRGETEAEPSNLRFDRLTETTEPALRFTPREPAAVSPVINMENNPMSESADALHNLMPTAPVADEIFQPAPARMESILADLDNVLENAPQPAYAQAMPAYRNNQADGERGMTFRSRIDSEIKRSPSAMETYIVQQGDTYMTISDKFYGTSLLYSSLAQHNQRQGIGWQPAVGVVIEVPTAEFLRTNYGGGSRRLGVSQSGVRYTVQEGDTVFRLATDKLQDSTRWREIYALNADQIQDVRDLKPGMEILLPAATAQSNRQQIY